MEKISPKINSKISEHLQLYQDYINEDYNQFLNSILNNSDTFVKTRLISNNRRRGRIEYIVFNFRNIEIQIPIFLITNSLLFLSGQNLKINDNHYLKESEIVLASQPTRVRFFEYIINNFPVFYDEKTDYFYYIKTEKVNSNLDYFKNFSINLKNENQRCSLKQSILIKLYKLITKKRRVV